MKSIQIEVDITERWQLRFRIISGGDGVMDNYSLGLYQQHNEEGDYEA